MKVAIGYIKTFIIIILLTALIFFAYNYFTSPKPPPAPLTHDIIQQQKKELSGMVVRYGSNPSGDIDKFLFEQNNQQIWLHFPPHTAKQVLSIAKPHSFIKIIMVQMPDKKNVTRNELQSVVGNNNETINIKDILPPPPTHGSEITISGNNPEIKTDENGKANAFVLCGKLIAMPPHSSEVLMPLVIHAKIIVVKGYERSGEDGFVNVNALDLIKPYSVMIDSVNYLIH